MLPRLPGRPRPLHSIVPLPSRSLVPIPSQDMRTAERRGGCRRAGGEAIGHKMSGRRRRCGDELSRVVCRLRLRLTRTSYYFLITPSHDPIRRTLAPPHVAPQPRRRRGARRKEGLKFKYLGCNSSHSSPPTVRLCYDF